MTYYDRDDLEAVFDPSDNEGFDEALEALLAGATPAPTPGDSPLRPENYTTPDDLEAIGVEAVLGVAYAGLMNGRESIAYKDLVQHAKGYAEAHITPGHKIFDLIEWVEEQVSGTPSIEAVLARLFGGANG